MKIWVRTNFQSENANETWMDEIYTDGKVSVYLTSKSFFFFFFDFQFLESEFYPIFNLIQFFSIFKSCQQSKIELIFDLR